MTKPARDKLVQLVTKRGRSIIDDHKRCEALLSDVYGDQHRLELFVLLAALKERIPSELVSGSGGVSQEMLLGKLAKRLEVNKGFKEELARWGVESWGIALGVLKESATVSGIQPPSLKGGARQMGLNTPVISGKWTNSLGMVFVTVPGTEVMFSVLDTRVRDYRSYDGAGSGGYGTWREPGFEQTADHPVVKISWVEAQAFCAWLTKKERAEGKIKAVQTYRLPTDAEWSVAVGLEGEVGGSPKDKDSKIKGVYPWGRQWPPPKDAGNYHQSLGVDDYEYTSPVGSFKPNKHGLYDMGGNVWQWCEDRYEGEQISRVLRGASWVDCSPVDLLFSNRYVIYPDYRFNFIGFRCVLVGGGSL